MNYPLFLMFLAFILVFFAMYFFAVRDYDMSAAFGITSFFIGAWSKVINP